MKSCFLFCVLVIMTGIAPVWADGTVTDVTFNAPSLGYDEHMLVYLPEGYDGITRYPVVYFLHGDGVDYLDYPECFPPLDSLIGAGLIEPVIFVLPNGMVGPYGGSMWTNSELYGMYDTYFWTDVVNYVDSHYATLPYRETRALMGHSQGGGSALRISMWHMDMFSYAASFSGAVTIDPMDPVRYALLSEYPGGPPYDFNPMQGLFSGALFTMAGAYSPNLANPPWMVDFPFDDQGNGIEPIIEHWRTHMVPYAARQNLDQMNRLHIYFDCGTLDEWGLYYMNLALVDSFDAMGISYEWQSFEGYHSDQLGQREAIALLGLNETLCPTEFSGQYFTMTQGQWGQGVCQGGNAACLRDQYFGDVYPDGMTVGNGYTLTFTTSAAVGAALPVGGPLSVLTQSMTDPDSRMLRWNGGGLAGEVIALKLNTDYAVATGHHYLDGLVVGSDHGAYSGMSGGALLAMAEEVLGGDLTALPEGETLSTLYDLLSTVNGNFTGGTAADPDLMLQWTFGACGSNAGASIGTPSVTAPVASSGSCSLKANYPNPFNPTTSIGFDLAENSIVRLTVYNVMGQQVATLLNGRVASGYHTVVFDATNLPSGMYIYRLEANGNVQQHKMLLMK